MFHRRKAVALAFGSKPDRPAGGGQVRTHVTSKLSPGPGGNPAPDMFDPHSAVTLRESPASVRQRLVKRHDGCVWSDARLSASCVAEGGAPAWSLG
jgi:hypothetical protein